MKDKTYHAYLDSHERQLVIHSLVELKNRLILIFKTIRLPLDTPLLPATLTASISR